MVTLHILKSRLRLNEVGGERMHCLKLNAVLSSQGRAELEQSQRVTDGWTDGCGGCMEVLFGYDSD